MMTSSSVAGSQSNMRHAVEDVDAELLRRGRRREAADDVALRSSRSAP